MNKSLQCSHCMCKYSHMVNWQDIQYFAVFARTGSLSAAARELGVEHVTVGRRIAALEESLGVKLIDRFPRSTALASGGEELAALTAELESAVQAILRRARGTTENKISHINISAPPAIAAKLIASQVAAFHEIHPDITLILSGVAEQAALDRGEADIAVRLYRPKENGLIAKRVGSVQFGLYATPELASQPQDKLTFIAYDDKLDQVTQQVWLRSILAGRQIVFKASDLFGQQAAAHASIGAVVLPTFMGDVDPALIKITPATQPPVRDIWLVTYPDLRRSPSVRSVMDYLAKIIEKQCPI